MKDAMARKGIEGGSSSRTPTKVEGDPKMLTSATMLKTVSDYSTGFHSNYYRVFVGGGNNFSLVRSVLKYRWWFQFVESATFEKCNLIWTSWWKKKVSDELKPFDQPLLENKMKVYARMDENHHLANKKNLFQNLSEYYSLKGRCVFKEKVFPLTFHIKGGLDDPEYQRLVECFH